MLLKEKKMETKRWVGGWVGGVGPPPFGGCCTFLLVFEGKLGSVFNPVDMDMHVPEAVSTHATAHEQL